MTGEKFSTLKPVRGDNILDKLAKILLNQLGLLGLDGSGGGVVVVNPGGSALNQPMLTKPADVLRQSVHIAATKVLLVDGKNTGPTQFILVVDKAGAPVNGDGPIWAEPVLAGAVFSFDWGNRGVTLANGLAVCTSSTADVVTLAGTDCYFNLGFL